MIPSIAPKEIGKFFPSLDMGKTSSTTSGYLPFADDLDDPTEVCTAVLKDAVRIFWAPVGTVWVSKSAGSTAVPIEFQGCHSANSGNHQSYQSYPLVMSK